MTDLTEAEIETMRVALHGCESAVGKREDAILRAAAMLIDARLAPIRAALDSWDMGSSHYHTMRAIDADLRAALSAHESAPQAGDGAGSHGGGERCACGSLTLATTASERHDRGLHGRDACLDSISAWRSTR